VKAYPSAKGTNALFSTNVFMSLNNNLCVGEMTQSYMKGSPKHFGIFGGSTVTNCCYELLLHPCTSEFHLYKISRSLYPCPTEFERLAWVLSKCRI